HQMEEDDISEEGETTEQLFFVEFKLDGAQEIAELIDDSSSLTISFFWKIVFRYQG
ncbi:MAG: hypothetical protein EZS28_037878, partial [Streblomastix strix]